MPIETNEGSPRQREGWTYKYKPAPKRDESLNGNAKKAEDKPVSADDKGDGKKPPAKPDEKKVAKKTKKSKPAKVVTGKGKKSSKKNSSKKSKK